MDSHLVGAHLYATTVYNSSGGSTSNFVSFNSTDFLVAAEANAVGRFLFVVCNNSTNAVRCIPLTGVLQIYSTSGTTQYANLSRFTIAQGANSGIPTDCWFKFYGIK